MLSKKSILVASALVVSAASGGALLPLGFAGDDAKCPSTFVKGVVYKVFYGDSMHNLGTHLKEIYLPERGFSFALVYGEVMVFRPGPTRYQVGGTTTLEGLNGPNGKPVQTPYFNMPGQEPRLVGDIQVRKDDADRVEEFLKMKEQLVAVTARYFPVDTTPRAVATWKTANKAASEFIRQAVKLYAEACVYSEAGGMTTLSIPPNEAGMVRGRLESELRMALFKDKRPKEERPDLDFLVVPAKGDED